MERLAWGHGAVPGRREVPEVGFERRELTESDIPAMVADPLPGESSDWAFFGLLAFTAVLFFRPQDQIPALGALHLAEVTALIGLTAMVAKRLVRGLAITRVTPEIIGLAAFGAVMVVTTPFSFWPGGSVEVITGMYMKAVLIAILMINSINSVRRLERFSWLIVLALAYLAGRAVFDYVRGVNLIENGRVAGAVSGIFGNPNDLAMNMVSFLPLPILIAVAVRRTVERRKQSRAPVAAPLKDSVVRGIRKGRVWREPGWFTVTLAATCALVMTLTVIFTKSRSGALGLLAMAIVLVYYGRKLRPGLGVMVVVVMVVSVPALPGDFWYRMGSIVQPSQDDTGSREARRTVMKEAWKVFLERPITGIGTGQFKNYNPPGRKERWRESHNVLLQVAAETGIFGVLSFIFLIVASFRAVLGSRQGLSRLLRVRAAGSSFTLGPLAEREARVLQLYSTALVASMAGWLVCALFASIAYNWSFYYLLGLCVVTRELARPLVAQLPVRTRRVTASAALARG